MSIAHGGRPFFSLPRVTRHDTCRSETKRKEERKEKEIETHRDVSHGRTSVSVRDPDTKYGAHGGPIIIHRAGYAVTSARTTETKLSGGVRLYEPPYYGILRIARPDAPT